MWRVLLTDSEHVPRAATLVLRLWVGLTWLRAGSNKLLTDGGWTETMIGSVQRSAERFSFYQSFIDTVVLTQAEIFASLVAWGEFAAGLSILLGVATRLGSGVGMFLSLNYMFLQGRFFPGYDGTLFCAQLVLLLAAAGRVLGADHFLHRRWPAVRIW